MNDQELWGFIDDRLRGTFRRGESVAASNRLRLMAYVGIRTMVDGWRGSECAVPTGYSTTGAYRLRDAWNGLLNEGDVRAQLLLETYRREVKEVPPGINKDWSAKVVVPCPPEPDERDIAERAFPPTKLISKRLGWVDTPELRERARAAVRDAIDFMEGFGMVTLPRKVQAKSEHKESEVWLTKEEVVEMLGKPLSVISRMTLLYGLKRRVVGHKNNRDICEYERASVQGYFEEREK